jgi:SAM-dependent methyltransferase
MTPQDDLPAEREAFRRHYEEESSAWGRQSGGGSSPYYTIEYRAFLDKFTRMNAVSSIVDIGCGDWQFSRFLNLDGIDYRGFDVVPSVVRKNAELYGSKTVRFAVMPDDIDAVPGGDLLLMKDVLQHLPNKDIFAFREKVFAKFRYCLLTNSFAKLNTRQNTEIAHGAFRCLDLASPPYSFRGCYLMEFASPHWERIRSFLYQR